MYEMKVNNKNQTFTIIASGRISEDEGKQFVEEYKKHIKSINTKLYTLIVDAHEISCNTPDVANMLAGLMQMYMTVPFKSRIGIKFESQIVKMQINRLGKQIQGFDFQWVDSIEEALKIL